MSRSELIPGELDEAAALDPTKTYIRKLEYLEANGNHLILCYKELFSGNGRLAIWRPKAQGSRSLSAIPSLHENSTLQSGLSVQMSKSDPNDLSKVDINSIDWQLYHTFPHRVDLNSFACSKDCKFVYLHAKLRSQILGYQLFARRGPLLVREIEFAANMTSIALNTAASRLVATTEKSVYFWCLKLSVSGISHQNSIKSPLKGKNGGLGIQVERIQVDRFRDEHLASRPIHEERVGFLLEGGLRFLADDVKVAVMRKNDIQVFAFKDREAKLVNKKWKLNKALFEDWDEQEELVGVSGDSNIIFSRKEDSSAMEVHLNIRARNLVTMSIHSIADALVSLRDGAKPSNKPVGNSSSKNKTQDEKNTKDASKKDKANPTNSRNNSPQPSMLNSLFRANTPTPAIKEREINLDGEQMKFETIQTLKFKETDTHTPHPHAVELKSMHYLVVHYKAKDRSSQPYSEIYRFRWSTSKNRWQFVFARKVESSTGLCFDSEFRFMAYSSKQRKNDIMIKKINYVPGQLPESLDLYQHLISVFYGKKNKINPQSLELMADFLVKNEFAFNDLIVHKELNILYLAVLSGSPDCLKKCLECFGYKKSLYESKHLAGGVSTMDPLLKAIELHNVGLLDTFSEYLEEHKIEEFNQALFFKILSSQSLKLKHVAVSQFLSAEGGEEKSIFISSTYPLPGDFELISLPTNTRDLTFKQEINRRILRNKHLNQVSVEYFVSAFPVTYSLRSEFGRKFVDTMVDVEDEIIMTNLKFLIKKMWMDNYMFILLYSLVNLFATLVFFVWVSIGKTNDTLLYIAVPIFLVYLLIELIIMFSDFNRYFRDVYNWVDIFEYMLIPAFMLFHKYGPETFEIGETTLVVNESSGIYNATTLSLMFLAFIRSLTMLRFWDPTRYLVAMIFRVFWDVRSFFVIVLLTITSFSLIMIEAQKTVMDQQKIQELYQDPFITLVHKLDYTLNFALGSWTDSSELNAPQYYSFLFCCIFLPTVMMNILFAIVWETFADVKAEREQADFNEILNILGEINYLVKFFGIFCKKKGRGRYIHLIKKAGDRSNLEKEKEMEESLRRISDTNERIGAIEKGLGEVFEGN